jgi:small multidrug resistance pump
MRGLETRCMASFPSNFTPSFAQAWWLLSLAIAFEIGGTVCMRLSEGFTRLTPSLLLFAFYAVSFGLNTFVVKVLGLSVVYAVWSGVGTAITAAIGILYFKEPATAMKLASIGLVVIGVLGVHASSRT